MDFRVLGPLEASVEGRPLEIGGVKQRVLLAMLLVAHGEVVSRGRLIDGIWGERPPPSAGHTLEAYVSRLRKIVAADGGSGVLMTRPPGYVLRVEPGRIDLARFRDASARGRAAMAAGDPDRARHLLRAALAEFRGEPLADLSEVPFAARVRHQLEDIRLDVIEDLMDAELATDGGPGLVAELAYLTATHPLRERLLRHYSVALYRAGRQAEALESLRLGKERLREELGLEVGQPLREVEEAILRHDQSLRPSTPVAVPTAASRAGSVATALPEPLERGNGQVRSPPAGGPRRGPRLLVLAVAGVLLLTGSLAGDVVRRTAVHGDPRVDFLEGQDSLTALDAGAARPVSRVALRTSPGAVISAAGQLWVADPGDRSVAVVGPDGVRQVVDVGAQPSALAAAGGSVWVANTLDGTLSRIDIRTDRVVQTVAVGNRPAGLIAAHGSVWVALTTDHALIRINSRSGRLTKRVGLDGGPTDMVVADHHLWTVSPSDGAVYRVSLDGRDVTRVAVGTGPTALTAASGSVWVANTLDGTVSRIDTARAVVTRSFEVGTAPSGLVMTSRGLWVADGQQAVVRRVDPASGRATADVAVGGPVTGLVAEHGLLWLASQGGRSATDHRGGTLRLAATVPRLDSIDPARSAMLFPPQLLGMTNDGLVTFAHTTGAPGTRVVPDLATSLPNVTDHGRTYRFQLRRGTTYSDGRPVEPGDIRRAIERDYRLGSPGAEAFAALVGAGSCNTRSCDLAHGIVVDDAAGSLTFHLRRADPDLVYQLAAVDAFAVPRGTPMHDVGTRPVPATGPYRIVTVTRGRLVLARNPRFHMWSQVAQPDGYPDRIVWQFGVDPQAAVSSIERGSTDWALYDPPFAPPADRLREIATEHASQEHVNPLPLVEYFSLNTRVPPFDHLLVRRALNFAVDRRAVVRLYGGRRLATPTCQILPPGIPGHRQYCPFSTTPAGSVVYGGPRLDLARRLVSRSGTSGMRVRVLTDPGFAPAHYLVEVLRRLGFRASAWVVGPRRFEQLANDSRHHVQVSRGGWAADYPSASDFLTRFMSCAAYVPANAANENSSQFCSPAADRMMARAGRLQQTDPQAAARIWARLDALMTDRAVWVPTVNLRSLDLVSARVGNYQFHPQWGILLDQLWVR